MKVWIIAVLSLSVFLSGCLNNADSDERKDGTGNPVNSKDLVSDVRPTELPPRVIKFVSDGNVNIVGTFYESGTKDSPAVLLLHQWQSDRKSYDEFAKQLQKQGIGVFAIDGRGFGESVKTTDGKDISAERTDAVVESMKKDVENAFLTLRDQNNVDTKRIGVVGASYGSSLALLLAAQNPEVKAVVLLSPGLNYFGNMPTEPAIQKLGDRALLMVAAEDDKESADSVRKLKEAGGNEKYEVKIYPKGGHGTNLFAAKVGLEKVLEDFLKKNL